MTLLGSVPIATICFFVCFSAFLSTASAQTVGLDAFTSTFGTTEARLIANPTYPRPNSPVTVTIESLASDAGGATIDWTIDGKAIPESKNTRSVSFTTKNGGEETPVEARIIFSDGVEKILAMMILPAEIDLIVEPDTHIPEFFEGKGEPASGATMRLIAIPQIFVDGKKIASSELVFTWTQNGKVLFGGPQLGRESATLTMPMFGTARITVTARTRDSSRAATISETYRGVTPIISFYEESTLYGPVLLASDAFTVTSDEITVRAEPFYTPRISPASRFLWSVDGKVISNPEKDQRFITLRKTGEGAKATIALSYEGGALLPSYAKRQFSVSFTDVPFISN